MCIKDNILLQSTSWQGPIKNVWALCIHIGFGILLDYLIMCIHDSALYFPLQWEMIKVSFFFTRVNEHANNGQENQKTTSLLAYTTN